MSDDYAEPWVANKLDVTSGATIQTEFIGETLGSVLEAFVTLSDLKEPYEVQIAVDPSDAEVGNPVFIVNVLSDAHPVERYSVYQPHYVG